MIDRLMRLWRRPPDRTTSAPAHVHDWGVREVDIPREGPDGGVVLERVLSAGTDCACGRCPRGICDGTGVPEPGWDGPE